MSARRSYESFFSRSTCVPYLPRMADCTLIVLRADKAKIRKARDPLLRAFLRGLS